MAANIPAWAVAHNQNAALEDALHGTAASFTLPADGVALAALPPLQRTFAAIVNWVVTNNEDDGLALGDVVLVRHSGAPFTLAAYAESDDGFSLFKVTDVNGPRYDLLYLGVTAAPAHDLAAKAAGVAAFGLFGSTTVVTAARFSHALQATDRIQSLISGLEQQVAAAAQPGGIVAATAAIANISSQTANAIRRSAPKSTAVRRLLETICLADNTTGPRLLFSGLNTDDVISDATSGAYDFSAVASILNGLIKRASNQDPRAEVKLTPAQMEARILLQDPPLQLCNAANMLAGPITPDTFSDMVARAASYLGVVYGLTLATALNLAGVMLAALAKEPRCAELKAGSLFKLLKDRLVNLHAHDLLNPELLRMQPQATRDRTLASRLAGALDFQFTSRDVAQELSDVNKAKNDARLGIIEKHLRIHGQAADSDDDGDGSGSKNKRTKKRKGKTPAGDPPKRQSPYPAGAMDAWRAKRPTLPNGYKLPCFHHILGKDPCQGSTCGQQDKAWPHGPWTDGLTTAQQAALKKWAAAHPQFKNGGGASST